MNSLDDDPALRALAGDVIELVSPRLRLVGMVIAANTAARRHLYHRSVFSFLDDSANGSTTPRLPYDGGFELAVRTSPARA